MYRRDTLWISHSALQLFKHCPRAYKLRYIVRNKDTGRKIQPVGAAMSLGLAVHQVLEEISRVPTQDRFARPLAERYEQIWKQFRGKLGGFHSDQHEREYMDRGRAMLHKVEQEPGPLTNKAIKLTLDPDRIPSFWLSEDDGIKLCGQVDWLEYHPDSDSLHLIDFKTGRNPEDPDSLQLPVYLLLAKYLQRRQISKVSYWYLGHELGRVEVPLPNLVKIQELVLKKSKEIKLAKQLDRFPCPKGEQGCRYCQPLEKIHRGEAEYLGTGPFEDDLFYIPPVSGLREIDESVML